MQLEKQLISILELDFIFKFKNVQQSQKKLNTKK
jgi:hypothetical protein